MAGFGHGQWGGQNAFFDPTSRYGAQNNPAAFQFQPGQFAGSTAAQMPGGYIEENPQAVWTRRIGGVDPMTSKGAGMAGMWSQVQRGFDAARLTNPMLSITDYVAGLNPEEIYASQSQSARGENPGRFAPRARTISRAYGG